MTLSFKQVMSELKTLGTAQNRKVYGRHGVTDPTFGVSYANLGKLKKKIKQDHALALALWKSGNHDARVLASMVADPGATDNKTLEAWVKELNDYVTTGAFAGLVVRTPLARKKAEKWAKSRSEWAGSAGWSIISSLARNDEDLPDEYFESCLEVIEAKIDGAKNRVRYSMNGALISIGVRNPRLRKQAVAAAKRIGVVEVDHGETGCKTHDAVAYIEKTLAARKSKKKAGTKKTTKKRDRRSSA